MLQKTDSTPPKGSIIDFPLEMNNQESLVLAHAHGQFTYLGVAPFVRNRTQPKAVTPLCLFLCFQWRTNQLTPTLGLPFAPNSNPWRRWASETQTLGFRPNPILARGSPKKHSLADPRHMKLTCSPWQIFCLTLEELPGASRPGPPVEMLESGCPFVSLLFSVVYFSRGTLSTKKGVRKGT